MLMSVRIFLAISNKISFFIYHFISIFTLKFIIFQLETLIMQKYFPVMFFLLASVMHLPYNIMTLYVEMKAIT